MKHDHFLGLISAFALGVALASSGMPLAAQGRGHEGGQKPAKEAKGAKPDKADKDKNKDKDKPHTAPAQAVTSCNTTSAV